MPYNRGLWLSLLVATFSFHAALSGSYRNEKLKQQLPIEGTNLFLNTAYKWHDRTNTGCFSTWFAVKGMGRGWPENQPVVTIVCNRDDHKWYDTPNAIWIFERTDGNESDSLNEYKGLVKIKNVGNGNVLRASYGGGVALHQYVGLPDEDMWKVGSSPRNKNHLQLSLDGRIVAQDSDASVGHRTTLYFPLWTSHESSTDQQVYDNEVFHYSFVPDIQVEARIDVFEFTQPLAEQIALHSQKMDLIDSYDISNDSPASISRTVKVSEKITNEFSWGFSESLKIFAKVTGSAGIPFIAEGKVETGFELVITATQNWKNSVEKMFELTYTVNVPAHTNVKVSASYERIKDLHMNYTAKAEITGTVTRISVYDDIVKDSPATGEMIRNHLTFSNFEGDIVDVKQFSVIVEIKGTMVASVGVKGRLSVNGQTRASQNVPQ